MVCRTTGASMLLCFLVVEYISEQSVAAITTTNADERTKSPREALMWYCIQQTDHPSLSLALYIISTLYNIMANILSHVLHIQGCGQYGPPFPLAMVS